MKLEKHTAGLANRKQIASGSHCEQVPRKKASVRSIATCHEAGDMFIFSSKNTMPSPADVIAVTIEFLIVNPYSLRSVFCTG